MLRIATATLCFWAVWGTLAVASTDNEIGKLKLYPIEMKPSSSTASNASAQIAFDFSKVKISHNQDGNGCTFQMERVDVSNNRSQIIATGHVVIADGKLAFDRAGWATQVSPEATESFKRANLALTDKGAVVGKMLVHFLFTDPGEVLHEPVQVTMSSKGGIFDPAKASVLTFDIDHAYRGRMTINSCTKSN